MRFELSTTIAGHSRLTDRDLQRIAHAGFLTIDVSLPAGSADLGGERWLTEVQQSAVKEGLEIGGVSAPWSLGTLALVRAHAIGTTRVTLIADSCRAHAPSPGVPADPEKLARGLETLTREALDRHLTMAVEFPRAFPPETIIDLLEAVEGMAPGVCLDVGHANLAGDSTEMIETLSAYSTIVHVSDNQGRDDSHRAPYSGSVDWPLAVMALWKTGFIGPAIIEMTPDPDLATSLTRAVSARTRLQAILDDLAQPMVFPE